MTPHRPADSPLPIDVVVWTRELHPQFPSKLRANYLKVTTTTSLRCDQMNPFPHRTGMQVHAVPDNEKAYDPQGKRLPWAYLTGDDARRVPEEKGPFGRSLHNRNSRSRSRTGTTPARTSREEQAMQENLQRMDDIFNKRKEQERAQLQPLNAQKSALSGNDAQSAVVKEATEVILYGYGIGQEWSAISHYETISNGVILEDYERYPPTSHYSQTLSRSARPASLRLSQAAKAKRNRYMGGNHWIKITFDSPEAAELACFGSPHIISGHLVYAEPFRGTGPPNDAPIYASNAGAQITTDTLPKSFSTNTLNADGRPSSPDPFSRSPTATGSDTLSSGTVQSVQTLPRSTTIPNFSSGNLFGARSTSILPSDTNNTAHSSSSSATLQPGAQSQQLTLVDNDRPMAIRSARRIQLKPASAAFLPPKETKLQRTLASIPILAFLLLPIVTLFLGSGKEGETSDGMVGVVPRKEDGSFDWEKASLYWRFWWWVDGVFGTDACGLKGDD
ncbi:hypothetical protein LTR66_009546 [Elasticomyces elasticus]|nr:hypothetical protein LTR66_009546 [Elasticomyces elasticus]